MSFDKIIDKYVEQVYGCEISSHHKNKIKNTVGYLSDNYFSEEDILTYLIHYGEIIDDRLWTITNSILKPRTYYYSEILHINSPAPVWHPEHGHTTYPFYQEMVFNFTIEDLVHLFYNTFSVPESLQNVKRDIGGFKHLLKESYVPNMETIDFIILLMKKCKDNNIEISNPLQLTTCNLVEVYKEAVALIEKATFYDTNKIVWRDYCEF